MRMQNVTVRTNTDLPDVLSVGSVHMNKIQASIDRAHGTRLEALKMRPREFGAWASRLHQKALALSKEIGGGHEEYNKWMHVANRHQITCIEGMLVAIENMQSALAGDR